MDISVGHKNGERDGHSYLSVLRSLSLVPVVGRSRARVRVYEVTIQKGQTVKVQRLRTGKTSCPLRMGTKKGTKGGGERKKVLVHL